MIIYIFMYGYSLDWQSCNSVVYISLLILQIDQDGSGSIDVSELQHALELCGIKIPNYQVRDLIAKYDTKVRDNKIDIEEFKQVCYIYLKVICMSEKTNMHLVDFVMPSVLLDDDCIQSVVGLSCICTPLGQSVVI